MAEAGGSSAAVGSLVAAAMETAGIDIHADILRWTQGDGLMLAGLLYLIAIAGALFTIASGGKYRWGRYLLVGPALFYVLTQTTADLEGSDWRFADHQFQDEHLQRALEGTEYSAGQHEVALFFRFWNGFTTTATQELLGLLNLTQDESHLNFLSKVERYMNLWFTSKITDANLLRFVRLIMVNQCTDYYMLQMAVADTAVDDDARQAYVDQVNEMRNIVVLTIPVNVQQNGSELERWMVDEAGFQAGTGYTCDQIWQRAVSAFEDVARDEIIRVVSSNLGAEQSVNATLATLLRRMQVQTNPATEQLSLEQIDERGQMLRAIHWVIARSLWQELIDVNRYNEFFNQEGHGAYFASSTVNGAFPQQNSGTNTNNAIRQFNRTETYQFKGDFVNAALALPHFQGVGLLLLAAAYPLFAMASILPSKAGAIVTWMGLWAWLKLWDLGFGVVMMIDNILYTMFPRGPAITAGDINQPGRAFTLLMESDPSYSSVIYYNIIAVCLYAVPIATGFFVKGAGGAFVGMLREAWQSHSTSLAGSAVSYVRALQGQSYIRRQRMQEAEIVAGSFNAAVLSKQIQSNLTDWRALNLTKEAAGALPKAAAEQLKKRNMELRSKIAKDVGGETAKGFQTALEAYKTQKMNSVVTAVKAYQLLKQYQHSAGPGGWGAAESAVAAGYYTHDTATGYPDGAIFAAMTAQQYLNQDEMAKAYTDTAARTLFSLAGNMIPPGGSSKK